MTVWERSPVSCKIFADTLRYDEECFDDREYRLWCTFHDYFAWTPDLIIYLDVGVETALRRIGPRAQPGDPGISAEYLTKLQRRTTRLLETARLPRRRFPPDRPGHGGRRDPPAEVCGMGTRSFQVS